MGTLHEHLHVFVLVEVTDWGITRYMRNHVGKSSMMMPSPDIQAPLRKGHSSNYGECARIITLCIHSLTSVICLHSLCSISWEDVVFYHLVAPNVLEQFLEVSNAGL